MPSSPAPGGAAAAPWTCPQCGRRVPARQPQCHCGLTRGDARRMAAGAGAQAAAPVASSASSSPARVWIAMLGVLGLSAAGAAYVATRPGAFAGAAAAAARPRIRGPIGYPALPPVPATRARHDRDHALTPGAPAAPATLSAVAAPAAAVPDEAWARAAALLDLPLRAIAADTSLLESRVRPFAQACVQGPDGALAPPDGPRAGGWLASLKTAALRPGITLTVDGAVVGCEGARAGLVAQADAIQASLAAAGALGRSSGVAPAHWRRLLAVHDLEVWDLY